ncbi:MAG TPA: DUF202 domain-containing protein [Baekduia sp.]|nr:DUF202 domain-containing protein [Baekduia sp.]
MTAQDDEPFEGPRRRTQLAAERTWLAWWRTGLGTAVAAIGVGAALPRALDTNHGWVYAVLGVGYALLAISLFVAGAIRQDRVDDALMIGEFDRLSPLVVWGFTAAGVVLALATTGLLVADV